MAASGQNGAVIVPLTKSGDSGWAVPAGTKLTEEGLGDIYGLARHSVRRVLAKQGDATEQQQEEAERACHGGPGLHQKGLIIEKKRCSQP